MKTKHSYLEIANDYSLWSEYVDPQGLDSMTAFEAKTIEEKTAFIVQCFGPEPLQDPAEPQPGTTIPCDCGNTVAHWRGRRTSRSSYLCDECARAMVKFGTALAEEMQRD